MTNVRVAPTAEQILDQSDLTHVVCCRELNLYHEGVDILLFSYCGLDVTDGDEIDTGHHCVVCCQFDDGPPFCFKTGELCLDLL